MDHRRHSDITSRLGLALVLCLALAACATTPPAVEGQGAAAAPEGAALPAPVVTHISSGHQDKDNATNISVGLSAPVASFRDFREADPPRVVVELPGVLPGVLPDEGAETLEVGDGLVTTVSRREADLGGRPGTRLEIGLNAEAEHKVLAQGERLLVVVQGHQATPGVGAGGPTEAAPAADFVTDGAESGKGSPCRVKAVEYQELANGKSRVTVRTSAAAAYELARISRDTLMLTLRQAALPQELARPLDTGQFTKAAIDMVEPRQSGKDVAIAVRFRQVVPYHLTRRAGDLLLEFDAATAPPSPKMTLAARAPETPAPAEAPTPTEAAVQQAVERSPADLASAGAPAPEDTSLPGSIKVIYPGMQRHFGGQKISLDFQNADVHNVLRLIAEVSGLNVITTDDVKGKVTMRLVRIPWDQALDIVLASCNLAMCRTDNVIRIAPAARFHDEQKQAEEAAQSSLDALRKKEQLVPLVTEKIRVNYARADQMKDRVSDVLSPRGKVSFDERTNTVLVRDIQDNVTVARELITSLDWPTPQVMIEARIVEATTNFSREIGVQWGVAFDKTYGSIDGTIGVQGQSGATGVPSGVPFLVNLPPPSNTFGGIGFTYATLSGALNIDARLLASEQQGKLRIISSPRVTTLDNTEAYIQQGEDIPYLAQSVDGISTQFVQTALKLTVTPHITPDGRVRIKIKAEKSEPSSRVVQGTPGILRKETQTELLVDTGQTVVLGGIFKDTDRYQEERIPFFHKIPVLGYLFKNQLKDQKKEELLIFITPKIVTLEQQQGQPTI
jgi:type IV pilus assembly protein PilQ